MNTCERCQGNGEIVTDWDRYLSPQKGDDGDEAVTECPDCGGEGVIDDLCPHCNGAGHIDDPLSSACGGRWFRYCECEAGIAAREEDRAARDATPKLTA